MQTANIDASATAEWDAGKGFAPIGDSTTRFSGIYQGKGYTIKGLTIDRTAENHVGLFGYTDSTAIVDSLGVVESSITGNYSVGALIGYNGNGTVTHCYSSGSVTGDEDFGGLIGVNEGSVVSSYSTSSVTGYSYSGGLVGYNNGGEVRKCYSTGSVEALVEDAGGLVGYNEGDLINSYSTGSVTGEDFVGGLVGYNDSTVTSCYWDVESSGTATGIGKDDKSQSVTGLTTAKMKQKNSFVGWDFSTIWSIKEGVSYPKLRIFEDESQSISPYLAINTGSLKPVAGGVEISGVRGRLDLYNISGARLTTLNVTADGFYPLQQQPGLYILRGAGQSWKVLQK